MWVQPTILAPANGFSLCARFLREMSAVISENKRTYKKGWGKQMMHKELTKCSFLPRGSFIDWDQTERRPDLSNKARYKRSYRRFIFLFLIITISHISVVFNRWVVTASSLCLTLLCDLNLTSAEFSLFDVLDTEVAAALGVDLCFVSRWRLIVRTVRVRRSCEGNVVFKGLITLKDTNRWPNTTSAREQEDDSWSRSASYFEELKCGDYSILTYDMIIL